MGHSVAIVVDRCFGTALLPLAERLHVWVCASPDNDQIVATYRRDAPGDSSVEHGFTTFKVGDAASAEEMFRSMIGTVELHHGALSHDPPWDTLEVYGLPFRPGLKGVLSELGVTSIVAHDKGFKCLRPVDDAVEG